ncbi:hypothetical protein CSA57_09490 [candidate division KSB3 bacterium]|nr:MAG: hypothetical protein CSA57_09490 [candidate division KSB3 bacterium]
MTKTQIVSGLLGILGVAFSAIAFKYFPLPYIWITTYWGFYCLAASLKSSANYKIFFFNLAFLALVFALLESYAWHLLTKSGGPASTRLEGDYTDTRHYYSQDDILGYAPLKGRTVHSRKYQGNKLMYDVTYTIGPDGLRISSASATHGSTECALFFGGSFTFGEGVNDDETLPSVAGRLAHIQVYNFGFHGYGPHQMLSALEHGLVEKLVQCRPTVAIYQAVLHHVDRAAGIVAWGLHSPRYILDKDGNISYAGHFDDSPISWQRIRRRQEILLKKSFFFQKYFQHRHRTITDKDLRLFLEIVDASRKAAQARFPGIRFCILLWDESPWNSKFQALQRGLEEKQIELHLISRILPNLHSRPGQYTIGPADPHPNAGTHKCIAEYVVEHILQNPTASNTGGR